MKRVWILTGLLLVGCSSGGTVSAVSPSVRTVTVQATATVTETVAPDVASSAPVSAGPVLPVASDFRIRLKIKSKECFGSAGCDLTFRIDPTYVGSLDLSGGDYEVTYVVKGGDSGPQINTFTITNGRASFDSVESIQTGPSPHLTARATAVDVS